jgi:hypothetical protein
MKEEEKKNISSNVPSMKMNQHSFLSTKNEPSEHRDEP